VGVGVGVEVGAGVAVGPGVLVAVGTAVIVGRAVGSGLATVVSIAGESGVDVWSSFLSDDEQAPIREISNTAVIATMAVRGELFTEILSFGAW